MQALLQSCGGHVELQAFTDHAKASIQKSFWCCSSTGSLRTTNSSSLPLQIHLACTDPTEHLRHTFKAFDVHGQGFIARQTFHEVMKAAAPFSTDLRIDQVFEAADTDSNGLISFREFASLMQEAA